MACADAQYGKPVSLVTQPAYAFFRPVRVRIIGDQQHVAASHACLFEQVQRLVKRPVGTIAG